MLLKSKPVVKLYKKQLKSQINLFVKEGQGLPFLKVFLVGTHPASVLYTQKKKIFCEEVGARCDITQLDSSISQDEFENNLKKAALSPEIHGILVQLPLPGHLDSSAIHKIIPFEKDVDGFHPQNIFRLFTHSKDFKMISCTPWGIAELLGFYQIPIDKSNICIIGRGIIVGRPLALLMSSMGGTVTLCHSHTKDIREHTKKADIIIVAVGKADFFDYTYLNNEKKQTVVDVGINQCPERGIVGDVRPSSYSSCHAITPVPGGVGPMTILGVVHNLIQAFSYQKKLPLMNVIKKEPV